MRTLNLNKEKDNQFSDISIKEESVKEEYPKKLVFNNLTVDSIIAPVPGVLKIDSKKKSKKTLVFSGGMHGSEKAGIEILDKIIKNIVSGSLKVNKNILLIYGNLRAMFKNVRLIEPEFGVISNLNRCFNQGIFNNPKSYAQERANAIMSVTEKLKPGFIEVIDIH